MSATKTFKIGLSNADKQAMAQDVYERLINMSFDVYDSTKTYNEGDFVVYESPADTFKLYKCNDDSVTGTWNSAKWDLATFQDLVDDIEDAVAFVNSKANVDGNYPTLTAGLALNLDSKLTIPDKSAFLFRTTAGGEEVGDPAKVHSIIGGTIAWNQLVVNPTFANNGEDWYLAEQEFTTTYENGEATVTLGRVDTYGGGQLQTTTMFYKNHVMLLTAEVYSSTPDNRIVSLSGYPLVSVSGVANQWQRVVLIKKCSFDGYGSLRVGIIPNQSTVGSAFKVRNPQQFDLTIMLGKEVADYIYNIEDATAGAGYAWFRSYFPKVLYPYTSPETMHVKINGIKMNRFNQLNIASSGIQNTTTSTYNNGTISNKLADLRTDIHPAFVFFNSENQMVGYYYPNVINTTGKKQITFTTPSDAVAVSFKHSGSAQDISFFDNQKVSQNTVYCLSFDVLGYDPSSIGGMSIKDVNLNFHWDGERDGEYEEYETELYPVDDEELMGVPHIDENGNLYFDGDEYWNYGVVDHNYAIVNLKDLQWVYWGTSGEFYSPTLQDVANKIKLGMDANKRADVFITNTYTLVPYVLSWDNNLNFFVGENGALFVRDDSCETSASSLVQKFTDYGIKLVYRLDEPTQSSATPFAQVQNRDNWGSEEIVDAHTGDVAMPVSVNHEYLPDLKAKVESAPSNPENDGDYVMHREEGVNTYTSLSSWLSDNGYKKPVDLSNGIIDVAGLTYYLKKAYKLGNIVFLNIIATNPSNGSTISANSTLFTLESGLFRAGNPEFIPIISTNNVNKLDIDNSGACSISANLLPTEAIYIHIAYAIE